MSLSEDQAKSYMIKLLAAMTRAGGSDLFVSKDFPPSMKCQGKMQPLATQKLSAEVTRELAQSIMSERQRAEFEKELECNFALAIPDVARYRVNAFMQQLNVGMVIRTIPNEMPSFEQLGLPETFKEIVMTKRGMVLVVGATDTHTWHHALKNTLRQAPDVILIGEIRDAETMEHAIAFAETGHLCMSTLHSNSASQTLDRIINFFPEERRKQLLMDLSSNLKSIISQRLVRKEDGSGRIAAIEILLNTPIVSDKLLKGEFHELKAIMGKSHEVGMRTFDWSLFELYNNGVIAYDEAIRNADSANELRLNIKLNSKRPAPANTGIYHQLS
jgi:twitching motility protein PilU